MSCCYDDFEKMEHVLHERLRDWPLALSAKVSKQVDVAAGFEPQKQQKGKAAFQLLRSPALIRGRLHRFTVEVSYVMRM